MYIFIFDVPINSRTNFKTTHLFFFFNVPNVTLYQGDPQTKQHYCDQHKLMKSMTDSFIGTKQVQLINLPFYSKLKTKNRHTKELSSRKSTDPNNTKKKKKPHDLL